MLYIAEFIYNYLGIPNGAQAVLQHLKLDLVACCNFSWREAHNKMLMCRLIALYNIKKTIPPTDEDQKLALLHAPFTGTTLFGGMLAKLQEANTKHASALNVFPTPLPPVSTHPHVGRWESYNYSDRRGGSS